MFSSLASAESGSEVYDTPGALVPVNGDLSSDTVTYIERETGVSSWQKERVFREKWLRWHRPSCLLGRGCALAREQGLAWLDAEDS